MRTRGGAALELSEVKPKQALKRPKALKRKAPSRTSTDAIPNAWTEYGTTDSTKGQQPVGKATLELVAPKHSDVELDSTEDLPTAAGAQDSIDDTVSAKHPGECLPSNDVSFRESAAEKVILPDRPRHETTAGTIEALESDIHDDFPYATKRLSADVSSQILAAAELESHDQILYPVVLAPASVYFRADEDIASGTASSPKSAELELRDSPRPRKRQRMDPVLKATFEDNFAAIAPEVAAGERKWYSLHGKDGRFSYSSPFIPLSEIVAASPIRLVGRKGQIGRSNASRTASFFKTDQVLSLARSLQHNSSAFQSLQCDDVLISLGVREGRTAKIKDQLLNIALAAQEAGKEDDQSNVLPKPDLGARLAMIQVTDPAKEGREEEITQGPSPLPDVGQEEEEGLAEPIPPLETEPEPQHHIATEENSSVTEVAQNELTPRRRGPGLKQTPVSNCTRPLLPGPGYTPPGLPTKKKVGRPRVRPIKDPNAPKPKLGRPRKRPLPDPNAPKPKVGRPLKRPLQYPDASKPTIGRPRKYLSPEQHAPRPAAWRPHKHISPEATSLGALLPIEHELALEASGPFAQSNSNDIGEPEWAVSDIESDELNSMVTKPIRLTPRKEANVIDRTASQQVESIILSRSSSHEKRTDQVMPEKHQPVLTRVPVESDNRLKSSVESAGPHISLGGIVNFSTPQKVVETGPAKIDQLSTKPSTTAELLAQRRQEMDLVLGLTFG